jgi:leader peptidase (prepilin peptidase) / N-methyltransferase
MDNFVKQCTKQRTALDTIIISAILLSFLLYQVMDDSLPISQCITFVWACVLGLIMGSYATAIVARMPKNLLLKKEDPYCATCHTHLHRRDLYTCFSYILNKGRCRFCKTKIPLVIFLTETLVVLNYTLLYLIYDDNVIMYIYSTTFICLQIIFFAMLINNKFFSFSTLIMSIIIGLLWYTN